MTLRPWSALPLRIRRATGLAALLAVVLGAWPTLSRLDDLVHDQLTRSLLADFTPSGKLAFLIIDDPSLEALDLRLPLPRIVWAHVLQVLAQHNPKAVAFDVLFDRPEAQAEADLARNLLDDAEDAALTGPGAAPLLAKLRAKAAEDGDRSLVAAASALPVVFGAAVVQTPKPAPGRVPPACVQPLDAAVRPGQLAHGGNEAVAAIPALQAVAAGCGTLNVWPDADGVIRRYPLAVGMLDHAAPSLAVAALQAAGLGSPTPLASILARDGGQPRLTYANLATVPRLRLADLLNPATSPRALDAALAGRVVLVGMASLGAGDLVTTPLGTLVPGYELHLQAMEALLAGRVTQSDGWARWPAILAALLLALGLALGGMSRLRSVPRLVLAALAALLLWLALLGLAATLAHALLPVTPVLAVLAVLTAAWTLEWRAETAQALRQAQEQKRMTEMKGEFLAMVSHELRTPMTSIRGSLGLLTGGLLGQLPDKVVKLVTVAQTNTERLGRLVDDVLDLQKMDAGQMALRRAPADLLHVVEEAVAGVKGFADQHNVALEVHGAPTQMDIDADRIIQVVINFASNAVKFSPDGATVTLTITPAGERVRVGVRDRGPGIPEELRARLFGRFAQARGTGKRPKGTGLGLAISKQLVELHGGTVGFDTELGVGTEMWFDLPLQSPPTGGS